MWSPGFRSPQTDKVAANRDAEFRKESNEREVWPVWPSRGSGERMEKRGWSDGKDVTTGGVSSFAVVVGDEEEPPAADGVSISRDNCQYRDGNHGFGGLDDIVA